MLSLLQTCTCHICTRLPARLPEQASLLRLCHRSGLRRTDRLGNELPRYLCHKLCQRQRHSSTVLHRNRPQVSFSFRKHIHARAVTVHSPWGPGNPLDGQPKGWPSVPRMVYSCSIPNQGCWSFTISIIFLHVIRRLVSAEAGNDQKMCACTHTPLQDCRVIKQSLLHLQLSELTTSSTDYNRYLQLCRCTLILHKEPACWGLCEKGHETWRQGSGTCRCWSPLLGMCWSHQSSTRVDLKEGIYTQQDSRNDHSKNVMRMLTFDTFGLIIQCPSFAA